MHERLIKHITEEDPDKKGKSQIGTYYIHTLVHTYYQTLEQWDRVQSEQEIAFIFNENEKKDTKAEKHTLFNIYRHVIGKNNVIGVNYL